MSAPKLPVGYLDRIRSRINIAEIIGEEVEWDLRKSNVGNGDYWAPCPFHSEETASLHVDEKKGYYYCFGCHAKGDAIGFLKEIKKIDFISSVLILARRAGLPISFVDKDTSELDPNGIIELKDFIVQNFENEHFLEVGVLTDWRDNIVDHPRLLRSLSWGTLTIQAMYSNCFPQWTRKTTVRSKRFMTISRLGFRKKERLPLLQRSFRVRGGALTMRFRILVTM